MDSDNLSDPLDTFAIQTFIGEPCSFSVFYGARILIYRAAPHLCGLPTYEEGQRQGYTCARRVRVGLTYLDICAGAVTTVEGCHCS